MKKRWILILLLISLVLINIFSNNPEQLEIPTVEVIGEPEIVFKWSEDRCEDSDIPDIASRAFRNSDGKVNLITSHYTSYRMIGDSLDTVKRQCKSIFESANDPNFEKYTYHEWIASPYTIDGQTVYSLAHNEWYASLTDSKCTKSPNIANWVNSITLLTSTDKGESYSHPLNYVVIKPPIPWNASFGCTKENSTVYGAFTPSNIIQKDGYYYSLYMSVQDPLKILDWGTCIMRTQRLDDASSWEIWTKDGWDASLTAICSPIENNKIHSMHRSVTYNTYLKSYVLTGVKWAPEIGVYYSLSKDLFHWSEPVKIDTPDFTSSIKWPAPGSIAYPTLLDPNDTTRNFEQTGQVAYIYYTKLNKGIDRDLLRQKIRFVFSS